MPEHQLRELIREVVAEILAAQRGLAGPAPAERTNGLVLFTGAALGFESGFIIVVVAIILDRMLRKGDRK